MRETKPISPTIPAMILALLVAMLFADGAVGQTPSASALTRKLETETRQIWTQHRLAGLDPKQRSLAWTAGNLANSGLPPAEIKKALDLHAAELDLLDQLRRGVVVPSDTAFEKVVRSYAENLGLQTIDNLPLSWWAAPLKPLGKQYWLDFLKNHDGTRAPEAAIRAAQAAWDKYQNHPQSVSERTAGRLVAACEESVELCSVVTEPLGASPNRSPRTLCAEAAGSCFPEFYEKTEQLTKAIDRNDQNVSVLRAEVASVGEQIYELQWEKLSSEAQQWLNSLNPADYKDALDDSCTRETLKETQLCLAARNKQLVSYQVARQINQDEEAAKQQALRDRAQFRQTTVLGVQTAANVLKLIDADPEVQQLAFQAVAVAETYAAIGGALDRLSRFQVDGKLLTAAALGDVFTIANVAMKLFASSGPSADEMILKELAAIRQQLADMQKQLNERFDAIDARLNDVLFALEQGFALMARKDEVILTEVLNAVAVSYNTQHLLTLETDRLAKELFNKFVDPCVQFRHVGTVAMSDETHLKCAIALQSHVLNTLPNEQLSGLYDRNWSAEQLESQLRSRELAGTHVTLLRDAIVDATGDRLLQAYGTVVNPSRWMSGATWYRDFLMEAPWQSRRVLRADQSRLSQMATRGRNILAFRQELLSQLEAHQASNQGMLLNWYLASLGGVDRNAVQRMLATADARATAQVTGGKAPFVLPFRRQFDDIEVNQPIDPNNVRTCQSMFSPDALPCPVGEGTRFPQAGALLHPDSKVPTATPEFLQFLLDSSYGDVAKAAFAGLGVRYKVTLDTVTVLGVTRVPSNPFLQGCWVTQETYRIDAVVDDHLGTWRGGPLVLQTLYARIDHPWPGPVVRASRFDGGPVCNQNGVAWTYFGWQISPDVWDLDTYFWPSAERLQTALRSGFGGDGGLRFQWVQGPESGEWIFPRLMDEARAALASTWAINRSVWASEVRAELSQADRDQTHPEYAGNQRAQRANALLSATVRFALGDSMELSDALYAMGVNTAGIPTWRDLLAAVDAAAASAEGSGVSEADVLAALPDFVDEEHDLVRNFLLDPDALAPIIERAKVVDVLEPEITKLEVVRKALDTPSYPLPEGQFDDADQDTVINEFDNCLYVANRNQLDTDGDGYGNMCDADYNSDGFVNQLDLARFRAAWGSDLSQPAYNPDIDMNGDGIINQLDLARFRSLWAKQPGPNIIDLPDGLRPVGVSIVVAQ